MRGVTIETAECGNTNCGIRRAARGLVAPVEGRSCADCGNPLYARGADCFCDNDECGRYLRVQ